MTFKELRKAAGLTQIQLAEQTGLTQAIISNYESGTKKPSFDTIPKLARALCVSADDIFLAFDIAESNKENANES